MAEKSRARPESAASVSSAAAPADDRRKRVVLVERQGLSDARRATGTLSALGNSRRSHERRVRGGDGG